MKNILGPMPWTKIMPTGGVEATESSLREWFGAGIVAAGIGSNLIAKTLLDAKDYDGIEKRVADTVALIRKIKVTYEDGPRERYSLVYALAGHRGLAAEGSLHVHSHLHFAVIVLIVAASCIAYLGGATAAAAVAVRHDHPER